MKIILLRHAETTSNKAKMADSQADVGLTKKGQKEATLLIPKLSNLKIDISVVSPLKRTLQTLQPFLNTVNNPKIITSKLTLERNLGDFTRTPKGTFQKYCDDNNYDKVFHKPQNGESIADTYKRAEEFLAYLKTNFTNKTILVCGHKNFLMCLEIAIRKLNLKDYYKFNPLKNVELRNFKL